MMTNKKIKKWDLGYALVKAYVEFVFRFYFRNIYVRDKHNIPADAPVIFAPNHQNALMDALAVVYGIRGHPIFLARADIFKNKLIAKILTFLKLMPVYRIRDGYNSLQNNEKVLNKVSDVLAAKRYLVIFPEGNHGNQRRLRPLKKGICRMALQAEEKNNFSLRLYIVPVGLDYEDYYKFHKSLLIRFGKPIPVDPYREQYLENPSRAYIRLKNDIASGLKDVMLHVDSIEYYDMIDRLREIYRPGMQEKPGLRNLNPPERLNADRKLAHDCSLKIHKNPEEAKILNEKVREFNEHLHRLNFRPWLFERKKYSIIGLAAAVPLFLLFLPLFFYGLVNNALPFFLPGLVNRNVKDPQFYSSIRYGMALVLFPLFYLIQLIIFSQFVDDGWLRLGYLVSLPFTGYAAYQYYRLLKKWWAKCRYNLLRIRFREQYNKIHHLRNEILQTVDRWVSEQRAQQN